MGLDMDALWHFSTEPRVNTHSIKVNDGEEEEEADEAKKNQKQTVHIVNIASWVGGDSEDGCVEKLLATSVWRK